jgi:gamma-glutamylcyclotransferase (GGCT)/AIG2-like uncharacterized protein YtfP
MQDSGLLFVYGTLRPGSGHAMSAWLARQAECLGPASVEGRLCRVAWYPALVPGSGRVRGELYHLRSAGTLDTLDGFEEVRGRADDEYERRQSLVLPEAGAPVRAWVYWYRRAPDGLAVIASGDWLAP